MQANTLVHLVIPVFKSRNILTFAIYTIHSGPENLKKVQAKKKLMKSNKSISQNNFFWPISIFLQFQKWPKIKFSTEKYVV